MALSRQAEFPEEHWYPWSPDGTRWQGDWPPEVWLVPWRLFGLGYRRVKTVERDAVTAQSCRLYLATYGHEPPRRGRRKALPTIVFEHARVEVIDQAALDILGPAAGKRLV
jgi:hypothetical protein